MRTYILHTAILVLLTACAAFALGLGEDAPAFEAPATGGKTVSLEELRGEWVVLFFYPKAGTPGCTKEACSLRDGYTDIQALGAAILGVSLDGVEAQEAFKTANNLPFDLISDEDGQIASAYGVLPEGSRVAQRKTFIINPQGYIAHVFDKVNVSRHNEEVFEVLTHLEHDGLLDD